jgi:UDP-glucose 4-epimerase
LVERLAALKLGPIVVVDNYHRKCLDPNVVPGVTFYKSDIRERAALAEVMHGAKVVFHLAAQSNVMGAVYDADYAFGSNVTGTFNVLRTAHSAGAKRVVFTSSREVYGDPKRLPVSESSPLRPKNGYGASKAAGEMYCRTAANDGLETVILRLANVYGPRDRDRVIPLFARAAESGAPLTLYGGDQLIDFVWIDTVVDALIKAGVGPMVRGPINIGSGKGVTVSELARRVVRLTGSSSPIHNVDRRHQEVARFVANIRRGQKLLGIPAPEDPLEHLPKVLFSDENSRRMTAAVG